MNSGVMFPAVILMALVQLASATHLPEHLWKSRQKNAVKSVYTRAQRTLSFGTAGVGCILSTILFVAGFNPQIGMFQIFTMIISVIALLSYLKMHFQYGRDAFGPKNVLGTLIGTDDIETSAVGEEISSFIFGWLPLVFWVVTGIQIGGILFR